MVINIKDFVNYINENGIVVKELPMFFSPKFIGVLKSIDSNIAKELLNLGPERKFQFSYADLTDDVENVSVLPVNRFGRIEGVTPDDLNDPSDDSPVWGLKFRQPMRIGTFVNRLLPNLGGLELEKFVHLIKGKLDANNYEIKLVRGEEIRKWYNVKTYFNPTPGLVYRDDIEEGDDDPRTPLMKSCLKQPEKQPFFDIYCKNPEQVGMLIMLNDKGQLVARAIIWFDCFVTDNPESPTKGAFMDRIYYTNESDVNIFIDYAKEHGWMYKTSQAKEITTFILKGEICKKHITIKLKNHGNFDTYPYLDTMCFYTPETGRLSTNRGKPAINPNTGDVMERYQLQKTNGSKKRLSKNE